MRTTIELPDNHRAKLHSIAARRGWRGYSRVIQEAVEAYLRSEDEAEAARRVLLNRHGSWSAEQATAARKTVAEVRAGWARRPSRTQTR